MWQAIAAQLGAQTLGSALTAQSRRRALREARRRAQENKDEFDAAIYADARGTAQAQASLNRLADERRKRAEARRGTQAVVGGTNASVAQGNEADALAEADLEGKILQNGQARQDTLRAQEMSARAQGQAAVNAIKEDQRNALNGAAMGMVQAGANMAGSLMQGAGKSKVDGDVAQKDRVAFDKGLSNGTLSAGEAAKVEQNVAKANEWDKVRNKLGAV